MEMIIAAFLDKLTLLATLVFTIYYIYEGEAILAWLAFIGHGIWCISCALMSMRIPTQSVDKE